jgi:hypothetical protein
MARLPYSNMERFAELLRQSGLPENTPAANAFRMFAHAPAVGAATLRLVFALLTETAFDPVLRELVILREPAMRLPIRVGAARRDSACGGCEGGSDRGA